KTPVANGAARSRPRNFSSASSRTERPGLISTSQALVWRRLRARSIGAGDLDLVSDCSIAWWAITTSNIKLCRALTKSTEHKFSIIYLMRIRWMQGGMTIRSQYTDNAAVLSVKCDPVWLRVCGGQDG